MTSPRPDLVDLRDQLLDLALEDGGLVDAEAAGNVIVAFEAAVGEKIREQIIEWAELEGAPPFVYAAADIAAGRTSRLEYLRKVRKVTGGGR